MVQRSLMVKGFAVAFGVVALLATSQPANARETSGGGGDDDDNGLYPTCYNCIDDGSNHYHNACPMSGGVMVPNWVEPNHRYYGNCSTAHTQSCP